MIKNTIKMKQLFSVLAIALIANFLSAQKSSDRDLITKINAEVEKAEHKQIYKEKAWGGNFEKTDVYYINNTPILIVKEEKQDVKSINQSSNGGNSNINKTVSAKFYIKNWAENQFVRVGEIKNNKEKSAMPSEFAFNYDKKAIDNLISK